MSASAPSLLHLEMKPSAAARGMAGRSTVSDHEDWMMPSSMLTRMSSSVSCKRTNRTVKRLRRAASERFKNRPLLSASEPCFCATLNKGE